MLQFIFGRPATGKTIFCLTRLKELALKGKESVLIVPEQFTFESEKAVLEVLGDSLSQSVTVLSFTRLYDEIGRSVGGIAGTVLSESDKIVFMNKTLKSVADELILWGKYRNSVIFAKNILDTIGEFKINAVTPETLGKAAGLVRKATLKHKLTDLRLIYETYDLLLGEKFIDPADTLTRVYEALKDFEFFKNKTVFLDAFKGFTGQQFKILERIFTQSEDVYISLTEDSNNKNEFSVYSNVRKAINTISVLAKSRGVKIAEPIVLKKSFYSSKSIGAVERLLAGEKISLAENDGLTICRAQTAYDEADFVAAEIRRLVKDGNYRFRDFVIIARDSERYQSAVEYACKRNGVSCFYDSKIPLSAFPLSVAALSAIKALNFSTEGILGFHKTGLGTLNVEEISALENYTFIWNISGDMWLNRWDMDVRGLTAEDDRQGKYAKELLHINSLRERAIKPLIQFKREFGATARDKASALVGLFDSCECGEKLKEMCREFSGIDNSFYADSLKQSFEELMTILDSLVLCFGEAEISKKEFFDALELALSLQEVGIIPQTLDEVIFGAADRIRPSRPKIAFVLGANQGEFPKNIGQTGIFGTVERQELIANDINISDNAIESAINENYLVYSNLCCPSDALYITYCEKALTGESKEPSAFLNEIIKALPCKTVAYPNSDISPQTEATAFSEYCRSLNTDIDRAITLKTALDNTELAEKISLVSKGTVKREERLSGDTARKLYGSNIYMSATRLDTFNRCHFSYFCRYGLGIEKLKSADFNVLQRGTIAHYCLERIIGNYGKSIADLDYTALDKLCDGYIEEYLSQVEGFNSVKNAKTEFLVGRIARSIKAVFHSISDEMKQSDFEPVFCEFKIGSEGDMPAVKFPFDGGEIHLIGSIDRVDKWGDYIRIIDYKTGSKTFKIPDVLFGLNMQMLLYLYCIVRGKGIDNAKAAGIFYKPAKRDIKDEGLAMNGLGAKDLTLVTAMEKENKGEFVPRLNIKKDGNFAKTNSYIAEDEFEAIFDYIERLIGNTGNKILNGDISVAPVDGCDSEACKYCEYGFICGIEDSVINKAESCSADNVINALKEGYCGN